MKLSIIILLCMNILSVIVFTSEIKDAENALKYYENDTVSLEKYGYSLMYISELKAGRVDAEALSHIEDDLKEYHFISSEITSSMVNP